jgi:anthranilate phosphoribosyltransferase
MPNKTRLMFDNIFKNNIDKNEAKEYLIKLYNDGETASDIASAVDIMRENMIKLDISLPLQNQLIDNCGTGGDSSNSFNISTTVSLLLSAIGSKVAKHGNRSITSKSGSADMLEALEINLNLPIDKLPIMLEKTDFCFMFAQNHHPAMKYIMPIRKEIPHRTIFNILGPLCNPAGAKKQLIGVFSKDYLARIVTALSLLDTKKAIVVSSADGMDEVSISDITYATKLQNKQTSDFIINPEEYGLKIYDKKEILGGDAQDNAILTKDILSGKIDGAKLDIVLLNTAVALVVDEKVEFIKDGIDLAKDIIKSKKAYEKLQQIIKVSNEI